MPPTILLPVCKHVERSGARKACRSPVVERGHKRGYVSVACKEGHQWVWCEYCCNCPTNRGENKLKGCILPSHWMERDSFDTGKRNHMQCHLPSGSRGTAAVQAAAVRTDLGLVLHPTPILAEPTDDSGALAADVMHTKRRREPSEAAGSDSYLSTVLRPSQAKVGRFASSVDSQGPGPTEVPPEAGVLPLKVEQGLLGPTVPLALLRECKHVDRKQNRKQCPFGLHLRSHKRGHLAVSCEAGHQWVWCFFCCDCPRTGLGCTNAFHWMERDSFDTGRRNHMQRHLAGYDAKSEWSNPVNVAALANGALMFPMHSQVQALAIAANAAQCAAAETKPLIDDDEVARAVPEQPQQPAPEQQLPAATEPHELHAQEVAAELPDGFKIRVRRPFPSAPRSTAEYLQRSLPAQPPGAEGTEEEEAQVASIENLGSISKAAEVLLALQGRAANPEQEPAPPPSA